MIRKTWAMTKKELYHILRSPGMLFLVTVSPILMLILMAYALAADVKSVPVAVMDKDLTPLSRAYVRTIMGGPDLVLVAYVDSLEDVDRMLAANEIRAAVIIQDGFEENVKTLTSFPVQIIIDGSEPASGGFASQHIAAHTQNFVLEYVQQDATRQGLPLTALQDPIDLRMRVWYNPDMKAVYDVVPALIAVILGLPAISLSAAIAREKEHGSMEQLIASPVSRFEILAGKMLPYLIVGVLDVFLSLIVARVLFGVPFRGSLVLLLLFSIEYFIANLAIGLIIAVYVRTQQTAMVFSLLIFLFPGFFLSGVFFPLIAMPPEARMEASMLPVTHFVAIIRGLFIKGVGMDVLWKNAAALAGMGLLLGSFAVARFQKKLA